MVWIKINDKRYMNADLITSLRITPNEVTDRVAIVCQYGEFHGETGPKSMVLWMASFKQKSDPNPVAAKIRSKKDSKFMIGPLKKDNEEHDPNYNDRNRERISNMAKEILTALITELESAKQKGDFVFDLEAFLEPYDDSQQ